MGSPASNHTSADRPTPITRLAAGLALVALMLFAPGAAANRLATANVDGGGTGGPVVTTRPDHALVRGSQVPPRTSDVIRHGKSRPRHAGAARDDRARAGLVPLAHSSGAGRLSRRRTQASNADPACEELSASEYSLVWPSLQATVLTVTLAYGEWFDVSHPVDGLTSYPPILPFTPRPPPASASPS